MHIRPRSSGSEAAPTFAAAFAGLALGHLVAYLVAVPEAGHRQELLARTGHGYLGLVTELALLVGAAALASVALRAAGRRSLGTGPRLGPLAAQLAGLQAAAFVALEVAERLLSHTPLAGLLTDHVLITGVLVQILLGTGAGALLVWVGRLARRAAASYAVRPAPRPTLVDKILPDAPAPVRSAFAVVSPARAPPSS